MGANAPIVFSRLLCVLSAFAVTLSRSDSLYSMSLEDSSAAFYTLAL